MRTILPCLLILALAILPACQMNERLSGTVLGGVGGGIIGGVAGGAVGAVIGAASGAVAGYLVGDYIADGRERGRGSVFGDDTAPAAYCQPMQRGGPAVMGIKERPPAPPPPPLAAAPGASRRAAAADAYERGRRALTAPAAKEAFETSIRLDPSRPEPYNALALNALYRGERVEAERHLLTALAKDPSYAPARHNLQRLRSGEPIIR